MKVTLEPSRSLLTLGSRGVGELSGDAFAEALASFEPGPAAFVCLWTALPTASVSVSTHGSEPTAAPGGEVEMWVEFSVSSQSGLLLSDAEGDASIDLTSRGGDVRVRVESRRRGLAARLPRDTELSPESLSIWVWPAPPAPPAGSRPVPDVSDGEVPPVDDRLTLSGQAAGNRVGLAMWEPITDQDGHCRAEAVLTGRRRNLFRRYACVGNWMGASGWSDLELNQPFQHYFDYSSSPVHLATRGSYIHTEFQSITSPESAEVDWNWHRGAAPGHALEIGSGTPVLSTPARLTLRFTTLQDEGGSSRSERTRFVLEHRGFPSAWASDMELFWAWRLAWLADFVARSPSNPS